MAVFNRKKPNGPRSEALGKAERRLLAVPLKAFQRVLFLGVFGKTSRKFHDNIKTVRKIYLMSTSVHRNWEGKNRQFFSVRFS